MIFALLLLSLNAHALTCDCPATDSMAKSSCGPQPSDLHLKKDLFADPVCTVQAAQEGAKIGSAAAGALVAAASTTKDFKEGLDYFSCYRSNDKQFCHYKKTVSRYIELAAESSHLPYAVQACLFNRESGGFKPNNQTHEGGAMGYVMFMPSTLPGIKDILKTSAASLQKSFDDKKLKIAKTTDKKTLNMLNAENQITYSKLMARKAWDAYWKDATAPTADSITTASLNCPQVAFALAAVVQTRSLYSMKTIDVNQVSKANEDYDISINGMGEQDSALMLAGAYNMGPNGFASKCGSVKKLQECIDKFTVGSETWGHLKSIQNCSTKGSTDAPSFKKDHKPANQDCSASKCSKS